MSVLNESRRLAIVFVIGVISSVYVASTTAQVQCFTDGGYVDDNTPCAFPFSVNQVGPYTSCLPLTEESPYVGSGTPPRPPSGKADGTMWCPTIRGYRTGSQGAVTNRKDWGYCYCTGTSLAPTQAPVILPLDAADLEAWRDMYDTMNGENWPRCERDDPCDSCDTFRKHVYCENRGNTRRIVEIKMVNNNVIGVLKATTLAKFSELRKINLKNELPNNKNQVVGDGENGCVYAPRCLSGMMNCFFQGSVSLCTEPLDPTPPPTLEPTPLPTDRPTRNPTPSPTNKPTPEPTPMPVQPSARPTPRPTSAPTERPSPAPNPQPTERPTTAVPTPPGQLPTGMPTQSPVNVTTPGGVVPPPNNGLREIISNPAAIVAAGGAVGIVVFAALLVGVRARRQRQASRDGLNERIVDVRRGSLDDGNGTQHQAPDLKGSTHSMSSSPLYFSTLNGSNREMHPIPEEPESEAEAEMEDELEESC